MIDLFEEARAVELDERLATASAATTAPPSCCARRPQRATRSLGWPDGGRIAVGAPADLVDRRRSTACASPAPPREHAARGGRVRGHAADVRHVVVGGELDRRDGAT